MKALVFNNPNFGDIRAIEQNGIPWLVGKDVAEALGYGNTKDALASHVDAEDKRIIQRSENATFEIPNRGLTLINESGLYSLILSSKLPKAKEFKHWVTSEVLPAIRQTGGYIPAASDMSDEEIMAKALLIGKRTIEQQNERIKALEADKDRMRPKEIFADAVATSKTSILIGDLAKILKGNGINIGQKRLFAWMRDHGFLIKQKCVSYNMPTQRSMEMGLFQVKEGSYVGSDGTMKITRTTKVTGKGQQYFINIFLKR